MRSIKPYQLEPILEAVDANVLVTDDADAFKKMGDENGRSYQVCTSHVGGNTDALVEELSAIIQSGQDHSLEAIEFKPEQALEDFATLKEMIRTRRPEDQSQWRRSTCATQRYPNQAKARNTQWFIACVICSWIAGTSGLACVFSHLEG